MTEEAKKGQWRECEIAGIKHLVWVPPPGSVEDGQPFPFIAHPIEAESKKWPLAPTEDEIWRKDYEAARAFANHAHALLGLCEKYEKMLAVCGCWPQVAEAHALDALQNMCDNIDKLADLKIKKLPHRDTVFISPALNDKEPENV